MRGSPSFSAIGDSGGIATTPSSFSRSCQSGDLSSVLLDDWIGAFAGNSQSIGTEMFHFSGEPMNMRATFATIRFKPFGTGFWPRFTKTRFENAVPLCGEDELAK